MCFRAVVLKCQILTSEKGSFAEGKSPVLFFLRAFDLFLLHYPKYMLIVSDIGCLTPSNQKNSVWLSWGKPSNI